MFTEGRYHGGKKKIMLRNDKKSNDKKNGEKKD